MLLSTALTIDVTIHCAQFSLGTFVVSKEVVDSTESFENPHSLAILKNPTIESEMGLEYHHAGFRIVRKHLCKYWIASSRSVCFANQNNI